MGVSTEVNHFFFFWDSKLSGISGRDHVGARSFAKRHDVGRDTVERYDTLAAVAVCRESIAFG